ncbi:MAG: amidase family protein [Cyanophyceae cyanobacterium]
MKLLPTTTLIATQAAVFGIAATAQAVTFNLVEATIPEIQEAFESDLLTSEELVQLYLDRIEAYDNQGPTINSFIELNPDALEQARELDRERDRTEARGPLFGLPVMLKDNIDTFDLPTTAGAILLEDSVPPDDAFITQQLREEGAIVLGKGNLTEWANFIAFDMPNGFSALGGQTLNPYGPGTFDVGGSSSGPGAAVAANLVTVAVGTETSGSILSPSSRNSIVGIKPTVGLVSRDGVIPIAASQDTAGPMARTVTDAAILLGALTGVDSSDPATAASAGQFLTDYTPFLDPEGLEGARIGVFRNIFTSRLSPDELILAETAFAELERLGATVIDPVTIESASEISGFDVLLYEFNDGVENYLESLGPDAPADSLEDIIAFNRENPDERIPFGQGIFLLSEETGGDLSDPEYLEARATDIRLARTEGIDALLEELELDAILLPNNSEAGIGARAGYPSITVPAGYGETGEPFGLTFLGDAFSEPELIQYAYAYEQGTLLRTPPESTPPLSGDTITVPEADTATPLPILALIGIGYRFLRRGASI